MTTMEPSNTSPQPQWTQERPPRKYLGITALALGGVAALFSLFAFAAPLIIADGYAWTSFLIGLAGIGFAAAALAEPGPKGMGRAGGLLSFAAIISGISIALWSEAEIERIEQEVWSGVGDSYIPPVPVENTPPAINDVSVSGCEITNDYGFAFVEATVDITNSTGEIKSYFVTVGFNDENGARIAEGYGSSMSLKPGQTALGVEVSGNAPASAPVGPTPCAVLSVERI